MIIVIQNFQSVAALGTFILAMVLYPEAQSKARQELDAVVGRDRLPGPDDEVNLPYVTALVREVLRYVIPPPSRDVTSYLIRAIRWQVVVPAGEHCGENCIVGSYSFNTIYSGVAHRLTTDDEYRGFHLKAGTIVVPNVWFVCKEGSVRV